MNTQELNEKNLKFIRQLAEGDASWQRTKSINFEDGLENDKSVDNFGFEWETKNGFVEKTNKSQDELLNYNCLESKCKVNKFNQSQKDIDGFVEMGMCFNCMVKLESYVSPDDLKAYNLQLKRERMLGKLELYEQDYDAILATFKASRVFINDDGDDTEKWKAHFSQDELEKWIEKIENDWKTFKEDYESKIPEEQIGIKDRIKDRIKYVQNLYT